MHWAHFEGPKERQWPQQQQRRRGRCAHLNKMSCTNSMTNITNETFCQWVTHAKNTLVPGAPQEGVVNTGSRNVCWMQLLYTLLIGSALVGVWSANQEPEARCTHFPAAQLSNAARGGGWGGVGCVCVCVCARLVLRSLVL